MLARHNQENVAFSHQNKQQQGQAKTPAAKYPKTPLKIPLNDENGAHAVGGANKGMLTGRRNENALTSKKMGKGTEKKTSFATPMESRGPRAVLGDKTTNAKTRGLQSVNVKSAVREIEKSQAKPPNTVRPKQKQAETQKLQVHVEEAEAPVDPLAHIDDNEVEYCPPRPKDIPYESDVFPDGRISFDALKPENMFKGYYRHYFNPIDENGVSLAEKELAEKTKKAIEEGDRKIREDIKNMDWGFPEELSVARNPAAKKTTMTKSHMAARKPLSSVRSRHVANALSMDDTTKSMQRKAAKVPGATASNRVMSHKKSASIAAPILRAARPASALQASAIPKKSPSGLEANSRTTIGFNKGRATASLLNNGGSTTARKATALSSSSSSSSSPTKASTSIFKGSSSAIPRSDTTLSNGSDKTITPARYQAAAAAREEEDKAWRERVPFLSIFNPEDCLGDEDVDEDDDDDPLGIKSSSPFLGDDEEEEEFEMKLDF